MNITYADQKDLQRAHDLVTLTSRGGFDRAIGAATKMAKLIKHGQIATQNRSSSFQRLTPRRPLHRSLQRNF